MFDNFRFTKPTQRTVMKNEVKVGILVLVSGILFYFGYHFLKGNDLLSNESLYTVRYQKVDGLQPSSAVLVNGFRIGQVEKMEIEYNNNDSILVTIRVKQGVKIGDSTIAHLKSAGPLAGQVIALSLGKNTKYYDGDKFLIAEVDEGLMDVISKQLARTDTLLKVIEIVVNEDDGLRSKLKNTLSNIELTTKNSAHLLGSLDKTFNRQQANIETVIKNFKYITEEFKSLPDSLKIAISEASTLLDSLNNAGYAELIENMDSVMVNMQTITAQLTESNNTVGALLNEKDMYDNLNKTILDLDYVLVDFQANPSKYTSISVFGKQPENEKPIIKSISPKNISTEMVLKLKREVPAIFAVSMYNQQDKAATTLDETSFVIDRKAKTITITLPTDLAKGDYILHATWLGASSGQSFAILVE